MVAGDPFDVARGRLFGSKLRRWFRRNGRDLPWRTTRDPYRILVSELMLQQMQVSRVVPRYAEFPETFPTLQHVARARPARLQQRGVSGETHCSYLTARGSSLIPHNLH